MDGQFDFIRTQNAAIRNLALQTPVLSEQKE